MEEPNLQQAIMDAINSVMSPKDELVQQLTDVVVQEVVTTPDSMLTLGEIRRRLEELEAEFSKLLEKPDTDNTEERLRQFQTIKEEMASLKAQRERLSAQLRKNMEAQERVMRITSALDQTDHRMTEWSEETIRQLVHTVKVISVDHIKVILYDGTEIDQEVRK